MLDFEDDMFYLKYKNDPNLKSIIIDENSTYVLKFHGVPNNIIFAIFNQQQTQPIYTLNDNIKTSTNVSPLYALLAGLYIGTYLGIKNIICEGCVDYIVNHLNGIWKVKNDYIKDIMILVKKHIKKFTKFNIVYVHKEKLECIIEKLDSQTDSINKNKPNTNKPNTDNGLLVYKNGSIHIENNNIVKIIFNINNDSSNQHEIIYSELLNINNRLEDYEIIKTIKIIKTKDQSVESSDINLDDCYILHFDGLSEPNPGESASGSIIYLPNSNDPFCETGKYITYATNNQAEYEGLIIGLEQAKKHNIKNILICGDSKLVIQQISNKWKSKNIELSKKLNKVIELIDFFDFVGAKHIYRNLNTYADDITRKVFATKKSYAKKYNYS